MNVETVRLSLTLTVLGNGQMMWAFRKVSNIHAGKYSTRQVPYLKISRKIRNFYARFGIHIREVVRCNAGPVVLPIQGVDMDMHYFRRFLLQRK